MKLSRTLMIALLIFFVALVPRLIFINDGLFHQDSIVLAKAVEDSADTYTLHRTVGMRYGLVLVNALVYTPLHLVFGLNNADRTITYIETILASAAVALLFLFISRWFKSEFIGIAAALMMAVTPIYLILTTHAKGQGVSLFFVIAAFYMLMRALDKKSSIGLAISAAIMGFSFFVRETNLFFLMPYALIYLTYEKQTIKECLSDVLDFRNKQKIMQAVAIALPIIIFFIAMLIMQNEAFLQKTGSAEWMGFFSDQGALSLGWLLKSLAFGFGVPFVIIGIPYLFMTKKKMHAMILLSWILISFLYFGNIIFPRPRYVLVSLLPLLIIIAYSLNIFYSKKKWVAIGLLAALVIAMFATAYPVIKFRHDYSGQKEFALFVGENTPEDAIIYAIDEKEFIDYYANRKVLVPYLDGLSITKEKRIINDIKTLTEKGRDVYVISSMMIYDPEGLVFNPNGTEELDLIYIGEMENDDFHHDADIKLRLFTEYLFKIEPK